MQQALPFDSSLQIAYVANHGTRIDVAQNINLPSIYGQSATYDPLKLAFGKTAAVTQYFLGYLHQLPVAAGAARSPLQQRPCLHLGVHLG